MNARMNFGEQLRHRRQLCRRSQLELAADARISTRHLSFIETGRSRPSRGMVLHLAELLDLPLRQRNEWLLAAGFSPQYPQHALEAPAMSAALSAVDLVLNAHGHLPALAVDRRWNLIRANAAASLFLRGVAEPLQRAPVNVMRVTLHPQGLGPQILNYATIHAHSLQRLQQQYRQSGDPDLLALHDEIATFPVRADQDAGLPSSPDDRVVLPICLQTALGVLRLFSTITVYGTPAEVTLAELAVESFFPADANSSRILQQLASSKTAG